MKGEGRKRDTEEVRERRRNEEMGIEVGRNRDKRRKRQRRKNRETEEGRVRRRNGDKIKKETRERRRFGDGGGRKGKRTRETETERCCDTLRQMDERRERGKNMWTAEGRQLGMDGGRNRVGRKRRQRKEEGRESGRG